jgi:hypothetical protein
MPPGQRRFPRIAFGEPGELLVTIQSLSCEGAGLRVHGDHRLVPGTMTELAFQLSGSPVGMLARVVWAAGGRAGMRINVATIGRREKRVFSNWIVPRTKEALARARKRG